MTTLTDRSRASSPPAGRSAARGMTLAELSVSLLIVSVLAVAMGSVLVLAARVVGVSATHAGEAQIDEMVSFIADEHRFAGKVLERTPTSVAFTVNRSGAAAPDTVRYAWSGVAGDPLTRQVNGGIPAVMVPDVRRFNLSYLTKSTGVAAPVPDVEVPSDVLLFSHEAGTSSASLSSLVWVGEHFLPNWAAIAPAGKTVTEWRVTRVEFVAARSPTGINTTPWLVRLYKSVGTQPAAGSPLEEQRLPVSSLVASTTPAWLLAPVVFSVNSGLKPTEGACVVIGPQAFSPSGNAGFNAGPVSSGGAMFTSTTGGLTFGAANTSRSLKIRVYGRYKYPGP
jgi:prepilin-type N-terminal cleavage/methylation domain-containing protein